MLKLAIIIMLLLILCSCSNINRTVTMPNEDVYIINMRIDDFVSFEKNGIKFIVDGRGRPSLFENVATMALTQTEFNLSNKEGK